MDYKLIESTRKPVNDLPPVEIRLLQSINAYLSSNYLVILNSITRFGMYIGDNLPEEYISKKNPLDIEELRETLHLEFRNLIMSEVWSDIIDGYHGFQTLYYLHYLYKLSLNYTSFWNSPYGLGINPNNIHEEPFYKNSEFALLQFAAVFHDIGEAKKGDKRYDLKLISDVTTERLFFDSISNDLFPDYNPGELYIVKEVIYGPEKDKVSEIPHLLDIFKLVERIGYFHSGCIQAWLAFSKIIPKLLEQDPLNQNYKIYSDATLQMTFNVFLNQISHMVDATEKFPAVGHMLFDNIFILKDIVKTYQSKIYNNIAFSIYPETHENPNYTRSAKIEKFELACNDLINFLGEGNFEDPIIDLRTILNYTNPYLSTPI
jgi:hypothetical protein